MDRPGRHWGSLRIPWSRDESAYGQVVVPVAALCGETPGPTALLVAGVHGDEWEGQVVLRAVARSFDPARLRGRVLVVPTANPLASRAGRRTSPEDGGNLARLFTPRAPLDGVTAAIAMGLERWLLPAADFVLDLHSGGGSLEYLPCAWGRLPADLVLARRVLDSLIALGAPRAAVVESGATGTLVAAALERGVPAVAAEIGGGGGLSPGTLAVTRRAVDGFLAHAGIIAGGGPSTPTRLLHVRPGHFLRSPGRGFFEPLFHLGDSVAAGQPAGRLHDLDYPHRQPEDLAWPDGGIVLCRRVPARAEPGDVLAHLAADTEAKALLSGVLPGITPAVR